MDNVTKYHLCKRCFKELTEISPQRRYSPQAILTLAQQIEQQKSEEYCSSCYAVVQMQENWKPLPLGSSIGGIFFVPDKPETKGS